MRTLQRTTPVFLALCFVLLEVACDGTIAARGVVQLSDGRPLQDATVAFSDARYGRRPSFQAQTSASGCFEVGGVVAPVRKEFTLSIRAPGFSPASIQVRSLQDNFVLVTLAPADTSQSSTATEMNARQIKEIFTTRCGPGVAVRGTPQSNGTNHTSTGAPPNE